MKKTILILFIIILSVVEASANSNPEYLDSGFKINDKIIWFGYNLESSKNICLDSDINVTKECFISCPWCDASLLLEGGAQYMLPVDNKGIFYFENEFNLGYYDINSKKDISITSAIFKILSPYEVDHDMPNLTWDDRYFKSFSKNSLNAAKDKLAIEVVYNDDATMKVLTPMICVVDINKLLEEEKDYIECPIVTERMRNLNVTQIPENVWKEEGLPVFEGWKDNNSINIQTKEGADFILDTSTNLLEKLPQEVIFKDIPIDHPLYGPTKRAQELGFISGYPDGTFRPDSPVNRAEFAKMLTLAFNKGEGAKDILSRFPDVLFDQWYIPFLGKAVELRIMEGYPDGSMKPANTIIKAEALKMALEAKGGDYGSTASGEQWYEKYRKYAADHFNLTFLSSEDMGKPMTRGECVELILEALDD